LFKSKVEEYIRLIEPFVEKKNSIITYGFDEIIDKVSFEEIYKESAFLETLSPNEIIIIETLYYIGRHLNEDLIHLSKNKDEGKKDFIIMCLRHMELNGLKFDSEINETMINFPNKSTDSIVENLKF
jgi:hypothetical protein